MEPLSLPSYRGGGGSSLPIAAAAAAANPWMLLLLTLAALLEKVDEALLPAVYRNLAPSLHAASPFSLSSLAFFRALVQATAAPVAAHLAQYHDRGMLVGVGVLWWGVATFVVGLAETYWAVALSRAASGIGLALVVPAIQSLLADCCADEGRGAAFGLLEAAGQGGVFLGPLFAAALASHVALGLPGWRLAFHAVAVASITLGLFVVTLAHDPAAVSAAGSPFGTPRALTPRRLATIRAAANGGNGSGNYSQQQQHQQQQQQQQQQDGSSDFLLEEGSSYAGASSSGDKGCLGSCSSVTSSSVSRTVARVQNAFAATAGWLVPHDVLSGAREAYASLRHVATVRTCQLVVAQTVVGQAAWSAALFFAMWLHLSGFTAAQASELITLFSLGAVCGALLGGYVGDWASRRSPAAGRVLSAQVSTGLVVLLAAALLVFFPPSPPGKLGTPVTPGGATFSSASGGAVAGLLPSALFLLLGCCSSWAPPSCNLPMLSEVVPVRLRPTAFAFNMACEQLAAAFGAPAAGLLAIHLYGFSTKTAAASMAAEAGLLSAAAASLSSPSSPPSSSSSAAGADTPLLLPMEAAVQAEAMAKGLFLAIGVPFCINVMLITASYWTYGPDKTRSRVENWMDDSIARWLDGGMGPLGLPPNSVGRVMSSSSIELEVIMEEGEGEADGEGHDAGRRAGGGQGSSREESPTLSPLNARSMSESDGGRVPSSSEGEERQRLLVGREDVGT